MDIYINERSFIGQARDHTLMGLMSTFAETLGVLRQISPDAEIVIHSSLMAQPLSDRLSLQDWLFSQRYRGDEEDEDSQQARPPDPEEERLQALIGVIRTSLISGPWIDNDLDGKGYICTCEAREEDLASSTIDGSAQRGGLLISFDGCTHYPDGPLTIHYEGHSHIKEPQQVAHFVSPTTARKCRRRYVPNPKHHPDKARGDHSPMELDRVYDRFTPQLEQELRDITRDPWDTLVQYLLDIAVPEGNQLYARVWNDNRKEHIYYVFQDDNMNGFHGYPLLTQRVPQEVINELNRRDRRKADL